MQVEVPVKSLCTLLMRSKEREQYSRIRYGSHFMQHACRQVDQVVGPQWLPVAISLYFDGSLEAVQSERAIQRVLRDGFSGVQDEADDLDFWCADDGQGSGFG